MIPGVNPAQMQGMMKKMGISQEQINASRVIIDTPEGNLVIEEPEVMKIKMQGQTSFQVTGEAVLEEAESETFSEEDVAMVVEKTRKSSEEVREFLEKNGGDIAQAIMELK